MRQVECEVAVIGAGTAGLHAWKAATAAGAHAVLIERGEGGSTCTRTGCMPSKLLIAAGRAAHAARTADRFGVHVADVAIDGPAVMRRLRHERDGFVQGVLDEYATVPDDQRLHGAARFLGPGRLAVGGEAEVLAGTVVIATGGTPLVPEPLHLALALVRTHETIFEIADLPRRLAVVGAGAIGLELAQAFVRLGVEVTVLDKEDGIGGLTDPAAQAAAQDALRAELPIHLGVDVSAEMAGEEALVRWTGASSGEVRVDLILAATGRAPALDGLELDKAGVPLDDKGVPEFDHASHRAGDARLFVTGDADGWRPVLHEAAHGGRVGGRVAAGGEAAPVLPALSIAFTEPNLVRVGCDFADLPSDARVADYPGSRDPRSRIDGHAEGIVRLYAAADGALLGGTIVAHGGEHLGASLAAALVGGMDAAAFAKLPWYHPVIEEMLQHAARDLDPAGEADAPNE